MLSTIKVSLILSVLAAVSEVSAHGYVEGAVVDGKYYTGYLVTEYPYMQDPPASIGWTETETTLGYISPDQYGTGDIICHKDATPAQLTATVPAGATVVMEWHQSWPTGHRGPVLDYMAACNGDCSTVDKTKLEFFKIDEAGLISDAEMPGKWASDELIANNNSWSVTVPASIVPGQYVLRHEIISLHAANAADGAQHYPQCINLVVTGGGSDVPAGTLGENLYTEDEPGILVNIWQENLTYDIPGPSLYTGGSYGQKTASASATQASSTQASSMSAAAVTPEPKTSPYSPAQASVPTTLATSVKAKPSTTESSVVATATAEPYDDTCDAEEL